MLAFEITFKHNKGDSKNGVIDRSLKVTNQCQNGFIDRSL